MKLFSKTRKKENTAVTPQYKMVTMDRSGFFSYDGRLYRSEIVRSCIRPEVAAIGKLVAKHIRKTVTADEVKTDVNPEPYMRFLLEEPNPYMTGQDMQEKMATQLILNGNAFALIVRDANGLPCQLYPIPCTSAEAETASGVLMIKFMLKNSHVVRFRYDELIHIKLDYGEDYLFGSSPAGALTGLMEMLTVMDQGLVKAIKNSGVIRWLLKFMSSLRPEDIKKQVKEFTDNYLTYESDTFGAAGVDAKTDIQRIEPKDYVPNAAIQDRVYERALNFFNTNKKIIQSTANEEEWEAYYEQVIEPIAIKFSNEYTRKLFTLRQRGFGNSVFFESSNLQHASTSTKLNLREMVDRGALTPNEWRATFNYAPLPGGDEPLRRKDTGVVTEGGEPDANTD